MGHTEKEAPMSNFPWKTTLAVSSLLAATAYAFAQMSSGGPMGMHAQMQQGGMMGQMHSQMMQGQGGMHSGMGMHGGVGGHGGMHGQQSAATGTPPMPGQDAFGTIQEIVQILQSDPKTDWSKVNIDALRQHLIDMNEVTLHAAAAQRMIDNGIEITVTGEGRTLEAVKRMVPAHVNELHEIGWNAKSEYVPNGVKLTVLASEAQPLTKLKALGFMGIMVQGGHHQPHHLMMAMGRFLMH
jgi:ribosomal protein L15